VIQRTWTIVLPYSKPPLTLNGGTGNRYARAALIKGIRRTATYLALRDQIPHLDRARITLEYQPRDKRRRDSVNISPTLKALADGIVDAAVLPDDDDAHCEQIPRILPKGPALNDRGHRLRLVIEEIP
jgi:crossover junction endodeoxyribonuclease RusA